jgi:transcriptional regulator with XRE-family HTH domain
MCVFVLRFSQMAAIVHRAGPRSQRSPHPRIARPRPERATLDGGRRAILGAVDKRRELGQFLKSRRARLRPEAVGLQPHGRRRVPGLRREELAQLAGVSVDYYERLEQGRAGQPSEAVLEAIARALRLDSAERLHLYDLSRPTRPRRRAPHRERVRPEVQRLLDALDGLPAMVTGRRMDVLAWNRLAAALVVDWGALPPQQRNSARHVFLDEGARRLYVDWEQGAKDTVASLRLAAGRHPDDPELAALVGELSVKSEDFRRWWAAHDVLEKTHGTKRLMHPIVGPLTLAFETLLLPGDGDQVLGIYTAEPGSESETALRLLASIASQSGRRDGPDAPAGTGKVEATSRD